MMLAMAGTNDVTLFAVAGTAPTAIPAGAPVAATAGATGVGAPVPSSRRRTPQWNLWLRVAGTGALTFQGRLWIYYAAQNLWAPAGKAAVTANRGLLNDANTLSDTTLIAHTEPFEFVDSIDGAYLQITTLTGTGAAVSAWFVGTAAGA
jgi:hypothetical protein